MLPSQAMRNEEVKDLAGLESSMAQQDADTEVGAKEQSSLVKFKYSDPRALGTAQPSASVQV
jgi:hypothetical protein